MEEQQVKEHFKKQVGDYVGLMTRLVPQYEMGQKLLCGLIPFSKEQAIKVLDLGTGPGVLSELILKMYPSAKVHAFDLTEVMLELCRERLEQYKDRLTFQQGDYKRDSFGAGFDVVLAGLTLHHLTYIERKNFFKTLYDSLNEGGVFLAREIIVDEDPFVTEWHYSLWREFMRSQGEDDTFWYQKHSEKDHPVSIENQLSWLKEAGFKHTACHWRYWNFAIISGRK